LEVLTPTYGRNGEIIDTVARRHRLLGMKTAPMIIVAALVCGPGLPQAQDHPSALTYVEESTIPLKQVFGTKRDWHVTAYRPQGDDAETGDLPVKICFWFEPPIKEQDCTPAGRTGNPHQNLRAFSIIPLVQSNHPLLGILMETFFSGGGSGIARTVSVSTYDTDTDAFYTAASIDLSELGEYQVVSAAPLPGTIVTASGLWQMNEGHFGSHRFWIQVYKYSQYYNQYEKLFGYVTHNQYASEQLAVIQQENATILSLLRKVYGDKDPLGDPIAPDLDAGASLVTQFYSALEKADGNLAATYVVPAKRNSDAFLPANITRFYSTLAKPLRLTAVDALGADT